MAISLAKNQSLSLKKNDGSNLSKIMLGLGWDAKPQKRGLFGGGGGEIDLDASCILLDANKNVVDNVFYGHLTSKDGAIRHSGDNLTGAGDGDDEQIVVDLAAIDRGVQSVVLVITSYSGQKFNQIENVFARVVDVSGGGQTEVVRYDIAGSDAGAGTGQVVAKLTRSGMGWEFTALGIPGNGKTVKDLYSAAQGV